MQVAPKLSLLALALLAFPACRGDREHTAAAVEPPARREMPRALARSEEPVAHPALFERISGRAWAAGSPPPVTVLQDEDPADCPSVITAMRWDPVERHLEVELRRRDGSVEALAREVDPARSTVTLELPGDARLRVYVPGGTLYVDGLDGVCIARTLPRSYRSLGRTVPRTAGRLVPLGPAVEVARALVRAMWDPPLPRDVLGEPRNSLIYKLPPLERLEGMREGRLTGQCGELTYTFLDLAVAHPELREPRYVNVYDIGPLDPERFVGVKGRGHALASFLDERGREVLVDPFTGVVNGVRLVPESPRLSWRDGYDEVAVLIRSEPRVLPPREDWPASRFVAF